MNELEFLKENLSQAYSLGSAPGALRLPPKLYCSYDV